MSYDGTVIRFRRATAARWIDVDPVLHLGEPGYESDTRKQKIGDGFSRWSELPYEDAEIEIELLSRNRSYAETIGDGTSTSYVVTHNIGTKDVTVQVYAIANGSQVWTTVVRNSTTQVTLNFNTAPMADEYRVVIQGRPD